MKRLKYKFFVVISLFSCFIFFDCRFGDTNEPMEGKKRPANPIVQQGEEQLTRSVYANEGEEVLLDLNDEAEYQFLMDRLDSAARKQPVPDWVLNQIEAGRTRTVSRAEIPTNELPDGFGHAIVKLVITEDNIVFATSYASILKGSSYIFLDIYVADENNKPVTEYMALEAHDGKSLACNVKGSLYTNGSSPGAFASVRADSLLMFITKDSNGDGVDDLKDAALYISYCTSQKEIQNALYPSVLNLEQPAVDNAGLPDQVCKVCLETAGADCDYSPALIPEYNMQHLIIPFKGEIIYPNMQIITDAFNKPEPNLLDRNGQALRKINMVLALEDVGGITKKIKKEDTAFFWNHPQTRVLYNPDTNVSVLSWDLQIDFGTKLFRVSDVPRLFVMIDVPVLAFGYSLRCATTNIIPKDFYLDTPFSYKTYLTELDLAAGAHRLEVEGIDWSSGTAGNCSKIVYTWNIDTDEPVAELINTPPVTTSCQKALITVGGTDVVKYSYKLDAIKDGATFNGSWSPAIDIKYPIICDTTKSNDSFEVLEYNLFVRGIDRAGNEQSVPVSCNWTVQRGIIPEAILEDLPVYFSNTTAVTVRVTGDGLTDYDYQLDTNAKVEGIDIITPITLIDLEEGLHTLSVWGADNEQKQTEPTVFHWIVDLTAPVVELDCPLADDLTTHASNMEIEVNSGDDLFTYEYSLDNGPNIIQSGNKGITVSGLTPGTHWIKVFGKDRAGNLQTEVTGLVWIVNPAATDISFTKLPGKQTKNRNIMIELQGKPGMRCHYKLDNAVEWSKEIPLENLLEIPAMQFIQ
jgi:hypothetical protein